MAAVEIAVTNGRRSRRKESEGSNANQLFSSSSLSSSSCKTGFYKSGIKSLLLSPFANSSSSSSSSCKVKKKGFVSYSCTGLGCISKPEVSVPSIVRSSADWQPKTRVENKKRKKRRDLISSSIVPDLWCSPSISFASDAASIDCVASQLPASTEEREHSQRNRNEPTFSTRMEVNLAGISISDSPQASRHELHSRDVDHASRGIHELMVLQSEVFLNETDQYDCFGDWRLDIDHMSYEELLELGDRIGHVSTGLTEEDISRCLTRTNRCIFDAWTSRRTTQLEHKCSVCQEDYLLNDDIGKLGCGHRYHISCIKTWLLRKNTCPVCKAMVTPH